MLKVHKKKSIWENQHLSLIMYTWAALKGKCEISKDIVDNCWTMFESRISAGRADKLLPFSQDHRVSSWSLWYGLVMQRNVWNNIVTQQLYKVSTPCIDDHHFSKEENMKSVGELSQGMLSNCFWNAFSWRELNDLIFYGSANKLARSITIWTQGLWQDAWIDWISYIHHTCEYKQYCHVGKYCQTMQTGDCFRTLTSREILKISKSTSGGTLCVFGSHTFVPISWMWKKETISFSQLNRIWNYLSGHGDWDWMVCLLWNWI